MDICCVIHKHIFSVHFTYNLSLVFDKSNPESSKYRIKYWIDLHLIPFKAYCDFQVVLYFYCL